MQNSKVTFVLALLLVLPCASTFASQHATPRNGLIIAGVVGAGAAGYVGFRCYQARKATKASDAKETPKTDSADAKQQAPDSPNTGKLRKLVNESLVRQREDLMAALHARYNVTPKSPRAATSPHALLVSPAAPAAPAVSGAKSDVEWKASVDQQLTTLNSLVEVKARARRNSKDATAAKDAKA